MHTLRLFGTPTIEGPHGPLVGRVMQRRRIALLAVLALSDRRTVTRDRLIGMFWPESDTVRARHNLADTLYVVRKALGSDVLETPGDDVRLVEQRITTDVDAFLRARGEGDLERAVSLVAGPLLDGFHVSGAPEFEHWLDTRRATLAGEFMSALERLIEEADREGRAVAAVRWSRRLVAADPLNPRYALHLMRSLAAHGDRAAALRHADEHARHVKEELGLDPDPALEAFVAHVRTGQAESATIRGRSHRDGSEGATPDPPLALPLAMEGGFEGVRGRRSAQSVRHASAGKTEAGTVRPRTVDRRVRRLGGTLLALGLLFAPVAVLTISGDPVYVADRIIVLPFENRTSDEAFGRLGQLAADVLVRGLARAEIGDVVLPPEMVGGRGEGPGEWPGARQAARSFGAAITVTGTIDHDGEGYALVASIADGGGSSVIAVLEPVPVDPTRTAPGLSELGSRVVGTVAAHLGSEQPEHPFVVRTPSYESYRTADRATSMFLRQRYDTAAALYRRAYDLDPSAIGYLIWQGVSYLNLGRTHRVQEVLDELTPRRNELTRFDAAQLDWLHADLHGNRTEALRAARAAREVSPHSGLGGFQVALELNESGAPGEAVQVLLSLDPNTGWLRLWRPYWRQLASAYHLLGRHEEELEAAMEGYRRHPGPQLLDSKVRALAALGRIPELRRTLHETRASPGHHLTAARVLHIHGSDELSTDLALEGLRILRNTLPGPGAPSDRLSESRSLEARLLIAAGGYEEARDVLLDLEAEDPAHRDVLGWLGFVEARLGLEAEARTRIERLRILGGAPYTRGGHTVARAAIHAELRDEPALVRALMERSHAEGWPLNWFHFTPLMERVRSDPAARRYFEFGP